MFVKLWMTENPFTVTPDQTVAEAAAGLQEHKVRRTLVVDDEDMLVGIISQQDITNILPSIIDTSETSSSNLAASTKVKAIMTANPIWVEPTTPLETVARRMRKHKIGGMPVLQEGKVVGIITESDILAAFMEVLGEHRGGVRIEMVINKGTRPFYQALNVFKQYDMEVQAITLFHDFGENQQLLTIRVTGEELEDMLDGLRKSGIKINRILDEEDAF